MNMQRITISQLSEPIRLFLAQVQQGQGIIVEDESGQAKYGIIPYTEASLDEKAAAWKNVQRVQKKAAKGLKASGVSEADVERAILEDD